ncbi:hypothetical protein RHGRI_024460 [Rhododendron griersonianum]|uniref:Uncharacterized protein n=1 Tax=Rhododendron griersonianum TaxID=479676 RepID=A0AAV6JBJ7_9ERIC|nr:hypothetical protein RHGRI_024460 [Rhododendron griersonianum]
MVPSNLHRPSQPIIYFGVTCNNLVELCGEELKHKAPGGELIQFECLEVRKLFDSESHGVELAPFEATEPELACLDERWPELAHLVVVLRSSESPSVSPQKKNSE